MGLPNVVSVCLCKSALLAGIVQKNVHKCVDTNNVGSFGRCLHAPVCPDEGHVYTTMGKSAADVAAAVLTSCVIVSHEQSCMHVIVGLLQLDMIPK